MNEIVKNCLITDTITDCEVKENNEDDKIKISTITMSSRFPDCVLNLTNIGKYLPIDNEIIGIKYKFGNINVMKGTYSTTIYKKSKIKNPDKINSQLFYNQISIIYNHNGNHINVKLFGNGSLHLTGCKTIESGEEITKGIYKKLNNIRNMTDKILLTKDLNGILLDKDKLVYSYSNGNQIIGYLNINFGSGIGHIGSQNFGNNESKSPILSNETKSVYVINKKEYNIDNQTGMFISTKTEIQRKRYLCNFDGVEIGFCKIELLKNKKKFYKKNNNIYYDFKNNLIYYDNNLIIGKIIYEIQGLITDVDLHEDVIEIDYMCNPFVDPNYKLDTFLNTQKNIQLNKILDLNVNCMNIYFNIKFTINRQRFYEILVKKNYMCKYRPESYSGVKLIYKFPINGNQYQKMESENIDNGNCIQEFDFKCKCNNKCTCNNITFLIFQSGNVIATGFKTNEQVNFITSHFLNLCNELKPIIKTKEHFGKLGKLDNNYNFQVKSIDF